METGQGWDFNCPQYVDFSVADSIAADDKADSWFDYDHENDVPVVDAALSADPAVKRVTRSQSTASPRTPNRGKPQTPQRTRARTPKGMKENITPEANGERQTRSKDTSKNTPTSVDSKMTEIQQTQQGKITPQAEKASKDETVNTPQPEVLKDVTEVSTSQRVTRSGARTPQTSVVEEKIENKAPAPIKNICTSLEEWKKKTAPKQQTNQGGEPERVNKMRQAETNANHKRQHRSMDRIETQPKKTKPEEETEKGREQGKSGASSLKRSCSFNVKPRSIERPVRHVRGYSGERPQSSGSQSSGRKTPSKTVPKPLVTMPTTPPLMKRKPIKHTNQPPVKNSEQLELEKIAYYRQELAKKKKQAQESYKLAMSSKGPSVVMQSKELTRPQGFHFQTDSRVKTHPMDTRQDSEEKDFVTSLRTERHKSPARSGSRTRKSPTKTQPFHFTDTKRRKLGDLDEEQAEKYESMAEKLKAFTATPDRYRSRPREKASHPRGRSRSPGEVTIPKTPNFETRSRSRPTTAPTREELEKKELEECQKNQFKARPVNTKIFENPNTGIKKVPKKPATIPEEFHLSSNHQRVHSREREQEEKHEFHAQPLNKKILKGTVGVHEAKKLPVTVPESPAFALKHRARIPVEVPKQEEERGVKSHCPPPHVGVPFRPILTHKTTTVEPFTFDERDRLMLEKKEQKINQIIAEETKAREFQAKPLPDLDTVHLPPKKPRPVTEPEPFNLGTDIRGTKKAEEWSHKLEDELRQQKEQMRFKAQSSRVLEQEPFVPLKPHKATTDISEFELNTAKRAVQREAFEMIKKAREDERQDLDRQEMLQKEAEEREEYERQRREAVHKAMPVKHYKPVHVQRSNKPLTEPLTPEFKTDTRLRTRAQHSDSLTK